MRIFLLGLFLGLGAFGEPHTVYIRGGRTTDDRDPVFRPVVALVRTFEVRDPLTGKLVEKQSICTGTVINRACVLSAAHCAAGPGERNLSMEVFNGPSIEKMNPVATVRKVEFRNPNLDKEVEPENDIALLALDTVQDPDRSFYNENLHDPERSTLLADTTMKIVGYGSVNSNFDVETKEWVHVGAGEKRDGEMKVVGRIDGKQALIALTPIEGNHSAGPGDSGGPLLHVANGQPMIFGVTGYMNAKKMVNTSQNDYISVAFHRKWLLERMKALGCADSDAKAFALRDFLLEKFEDLELASKKLRGRRMAPADEAKLQDLLLGAAGLGGGPFGHMELGAPTLDANGNLTLPYRAYYAADPQVDVNAGIRQGKRSNDRPAGKIVLRTNKKSRENLVHPIHRERRR